MRCRKVVGPVVALLSLVVAPGAHAALAGANGATTIRPDLRSATIDADGVSVRVCFDEPLQNPGPAGFAAASFRLAGYQSDVISDPPTGTVARDASNGNCAVAQFPDEDIVTYSTVQVAPGAVTAAASGQTNLADGTALSGSADQSGTRGHTVAPDVVGVSPDPSFNRLNVIFDQPVVPGATPEADFYTVAGGPPAVGTLVGTAGNVGVYQFGAADQVTGAVRAFVPYDSVRTTQPGQPTPNPSGSAIVPGTSGATIRPDLVSVALTPDQTALDFVYDQPVATPDATQFAVWASFAGSGQGQTATLVSPTTVRVVPDTGGASLSVFAEYAVWGSASPTAVQDPSQAGLTGTGGGGPVGGNAGAFSSGFTTGPDAFSVALDTQGNRVDVTWDQRVAGADPTQIDLLDNSGDVIATPTPATIVPSYPATPGAMTIGFQYTEAGVVSLAKAVALDGHNVAADPSPVVGTPLGYGPGFNQRQILSPTATSSVLRYSRSRRTATLRRGVRLHRVRRAHRLRRR